MIAFLRLRVKNLICRLGFTSNFIEYCTDCGIRQPLVWWSRNKELWIAVNGTEIGALCPECFDRRATKAGYFLRWYPEDESELIK